MDLSTAVQAYLIAHGSITIGAIITFVVRVEHRLTRLETMVDMSLKNPGVLKNNPNPPPQDP